ncbi:hypothetical protein D3C71_1620500 [compost metagenome]
MRHHLDIGVGVDAFGALLGHHAAEIADGRRRAGGRAIGHAHLAALDEGIAQQAGIFKRQLADARGHQRHPAHAAHGLAVVVGRQIERLGGRTELGGQALVILPFLHALNLVAPAQQLRAHRLPVIAQGADARHARHDDALCCLAHPIIPPFTEITWRVM